MGRGSSDIETSGVARTPVASAASEDYELPNGSVLRRGGRVRVPKDLPWQIPQEDVRRMGLRLEEGSQSPGSEVLVWPESSEQFRRDQEERARRTEP